MDPVVSALDVKGLMNLEKLVGWSTYVKQVIADIEEELKKVDKHLVTKVKTPLLNSYQLELDMSKELNPK